jgi:hypothetical protein
MTEIGAFFPLPRVVAKVPSPNPQRPFAVTPARAATISQRAARQAGYTIGTVYGTRLLRMDRIRGLVASEIVAARPRGNAQDARERAAGSRGCPPGKRRALEGSHAARRRPGNGDGRPSICRID